MGRMENEIIVKMLQDGQGDQQQLLEMLWKQNVSLVRKIIQESTGIERWNQDFEDLEQQAFLGILESISRYDFSQGNRFFTYATHYIVKSLGGSI
nr:MAG TPA: DNA directed RNA polymerase subunit [Caudoviricetes sp.]